MLIETCKLYMVGVIKERERERERRGWIGRIAARMWIHEMCRRKCRLHGHEVSRVWLRGNLQSGAVTRGGASAPTLHHEAIMMLGELFYLYVVSFSC